MTTPLKSSLLLTLQKIGQYPGRFKAYSRSDCRFHVIQQSCLKFEIRRWVFQKYVGRKLVRIQPISPFDTFSWPALVGDISDGIMSVQFNGTIFFFLLVSAKSILKSSGKEMKSVLLTNVCLFHSQSTLLLQYVIVTARLSGILKAKQKLGRTFNSDKLGGIAFTRISKLTMCST